MAVTFVIPSALREYAAGRGEVHLAAAPATLADALVLLWQECPAVRDRIVNERGEVRPHINVFIDGENVRHAGRLKAAVRDGSEIMLLPAVSGG
jgi:molybdopterin converting factor small subunit